MDRENRLSPSELEQTGLEQKLTSAFANQNIELAIELLKSIDVALSGKAQCEFANVRDLANLREGLRALCSRGKEYVFYLSDGGSRLILTLSSIEPSRNFYNETKEKWEKIK